MSKELTPIETLEKCLSLGSLHDFTSSKVTLSTEFISQLLKDIRKKEREAAENTMVYCDGKRLSQFDAEQFLNENYPL
jgi:hypothetical protein